jgi:hypothetical protein
MPTAGNVGKAQHWNSRGHFFAAAEAVRRILVEQARRKHGVKHGGDLLRVRRRSRQSRQRRRYLRGRGDWPSSVSGDGVYCGISLEDKLKQQVPLELEKNPYRG